MPRASPRRLLPRRGRASRRGPAAAASLPGRVRARRTQSARTGARCGRATVRRTFSFQCTGELMTWPRGSPAPAALRPRRDGGGAVALSRGLAQGEGARATWQRRNVAKRAGADSSPPPPLRPPGRARHRRRLRHRPGDHAPAGCALAAAARVSGRAASASQRLTPLYGRSAARRARRHRRPPRRGGGGHGGAAARRGPRGGRHERGRAVAGAPRWLARLAASPRRLTRAAQADAERAVAFTVQRFGALDVLVNCAAGNFLALPEGATPFCVLAPSRAAATI